MNDVADEIDPTDAGEPEEAVFFGVAPTSVVSTLPARTARGLFFAPERDIMWDTWVHHHEGTFYLYYLIWTDGKPDGVGLSTSRDGLSWDERGRVISKSPEAVWLGSGALWPRVGDGAEQRFLLSFAEWRDHGGWGTTTMFFAESTDLVNWTRLDDDEYEFRHSGPGSEPRGRWDNLWAVSRPGGGYYGYWIVARTDETPGFGFGQSDDGLVWEALEPVVLSDVPWGPPQQRSPEIAAAYRRGDRYYTLAGLDDLEPFISEDFMEFRPGETTFIADRPEGPFVPSPKNRRLLVGNASYFTRFVDTPDGVLVNHHSWEKSIAPSKMNVDWDTISLAPFKRATWDDDGTLRLTWWEGNDAAKTTRVALAPALADTDFDPDATLLLEGVLGLASAPAGLHLAGDHGRGTAFLVHESGFVEYGDADADGSGFVRVGSLDREVPFGDEVRFRLLRRGRMTEFYLDDHLMQCYSPPERGTGRIALVGPASRFRDLEASYCA